jgi:Holliday junction resolvase RusA-like endonuclease
MRAVKAEWNPKGLLALVILFESKLWLTQKRTVRRMDGDNRVKPLVDVVSQGLNIDDKRFWEIHSYKVASQDRDVSHLYLFDLGDVIHYTRRNED